ncbi:type IV pilus modification PilV family protein [Aquisalibacillus elongatus]|uniref:Pilin/secretion family protein with methylation motif n=1 Tax=Aquisalibacillus elongatus TaxID=485577 RepID=A0A3N5AZQ5_9BACI|nr:type II secretion system protein [Aquisalibacillus elongatus]RPF50564.1 pilin/secretion family protein with methylation motif [Aquisalibacillus elongatus]
MNYLKNQNGISLIEILGSIVILAIVLTGFFSVFTQSALMQNQNEKELVINHLARIALEDVRELGEEYHGEFTQFNITGHPSIPSVNPDGSFHSKPSYFLKLEFTPTDPNLIQATILIINDTGKVLTKTYGYIEVDS